MLLDNDKTVIENTSKLPLTPELMMELGFKVYDTHNFGNGRVIYQDPQHHYIKFKESDTKTNLANILNKKGQRYCYMVDLELHPLNIIQTYVLYTYQDLQLFYKAVKELEDFEDEIREK